MAPRTSTAPVRTCIGCRRRDNAPELVRVVARRAPGEPSTVVIDTTRSLPGRGAWLHRTADCVSAAMRRRAFGPALRDRGLTVNPQDLADLIDEITPTDPTRDQDR
ncbi:YlxR family protein [Gordonia malaquae]|uniref:YlxR family protein n=1 Tax=Gordonia malaquae TaxID=410332 RepID=UPI0030160AE7